MASYKELVAQRKKLEEQIEAAHAKEVAQVIAQVRQIIEDYGLTADDLGFKGKASRTKRPVAPKYQDPKTGATWSGRGRPPTWISGKNFERFLIA
jgi:DNA-binding protein H-NS